MGIFSSDGIVPDPQNKPRLSHNIFLSVKIYVPSTFTHPKLAIYRSTGSYFIHLTTQKSYPSPPAWHVAVLGAGSCG